MSVNEGQVSYNGVLLGRGTAYRIRQFDGFRSLDVRSGTREFPRQHGGIPGEHYAGSKQLFMEIAVVLTDSEEPLEQLLKALTPQTVESQLLYRSMTADEFMLRARPVRVSRRWANDGPWQFATVLVEWEVADPRTYSPAAQEVLFDPYDATGSAIDYLIDYPKDWAASTGGGQLEIANDGNGDAYPVLQATAVGGALSEVKWTNLTTNVTTHVITTISDGQTLIIDFDAYVRGLKSSIISIGGASRYGSWQHPRKVLALSSGNNTIRFEKVGAGNAVGRLKFRDTWLT